MNHTLAIAHMLFEPPPPRGFTATGLLLYLVAVGLIALGTGMVMSRLAQRMIPDDEDQVTADAPEDHDATGSHPPR